MILSWTCSLLCQALVLHVRLLSKLQGCAIVADTDTGGGGPAMGNLVGNALSDIGQEGSQSTASLGLQHQPEQLDRFATDDSLLSSKRV